MYCIVENADFRPANVERRNVGRAKIVTALSCHSAAIRRRTVAFRPPRKTRSRPIRRNAAVAGAARISDFRRSRKLCLLHRRQSFHVVQLALRQTERRDMIFSAFLSFLYERWRVGRRTIDVVFKSACEKSRRRRVNADEATTIGSLLFRCSVSIPQQPLRRKASAYSRSKVRQRPFVRSSPLDGGRLLR